MGISVSRLTALVVSQVTCLDRSGRPVLPPLFACEMRARPALAVLAWSGDGSPFGDVPPRAGFKSPSDTFSIYRY